MMRRIIDGFWRDYERRGPVAFLVMVLLSFMCVFGLAIALIATRGAAIVLVFAACAVYFWRTGK